MGELRNQYKIEVDEERIDILAGVTGSHKATHAITDDQEILERKKAWADLEREQQDVKRDIKSLMRAEPASRILVDDPALAERVGQTNIISSNHAETILSGGKNNFSSDRQTGSTTEQIQMPQSKK